MTKLKQKTIFTCQTCGYQSIKWLGRCPDCSTWNSLIEEAFEPVSLKPPGDFAYGFPQESPVLIKDVDSLQLERFDTGMAELDRVIGGGIVPGSVVLVGGDPGIGKSTLLLQASNSVSAQKKVLYVSGEESIRQTKMRSDRLGIASKNLFVLSETSLDAITKHIRDIKPDLLVIDSIQVVYKQDMSSAPGSVSQVRLCGQELVFLAKKTGMAVFLVGHVTKEGNIAGPRVLEHMVDTVLYFEGESHLHFRILRAVKNRFGSTNEIGIFEMTDKGLKEVLNPSGIFIEERPEGISGFSIVPTLEGTRPLLVEVQALVSPTNFSVPKREARGVDYNRVSLIAAVLERRVGLEFGRFDIYVNVAGGVKIVEPAADLGIALSIASNHGDKPIDPKCVVLGEVGLGGEIRAVNQVESRLRESGLLGFSRAIIPKSNAPTEKKINIDIIPVTYLNEAVNIIFGK